MIRRAFRDGDQAAIVDLHRRVYGAEHGMGDGFVAGVRAALATARAGGWPDRGGGVWLVEGEIGDAAGGTVLLGSLGLIDEGDGRGRVRRFVLDPSLRGQGLGRELIDELMLLARSQGMTELVLDTFSALGTAAHLYRSHGFAVTDERIREDWGAPITYQRYVAALA